MKNIWILGLALFIGVTLSSCDDDDVRPRAVVPAGTMDFNDNNNNGFDDEIDDGFDDGLLDDGTFEDGLN